MPVPSAGKATVARPSSRTRSHRAAGGAVDGGVVRPAVALERHGVDDDLRGQVAGRRDDRVAELDGRLADGRELDLVAADALDLARDARRHPQRRGGRAHDGVDLEVADVAVPELDARHSDLPPASVRTSTGEPAAWYTRGSRRDIAVTTS